MAKPRRPGSKDAQRDRGAPDAVSVVDQVIGESIARQIERALADGGGRAASLESLLDDLASAGEDISRPACGASEAALAMLERALGWPLPEPHRQLLRRIGYLEVGNVSLLGVAPKDPDRDLLATRAALHEELALRERDGDCSQARMEAVHDRLRQLAPVLWIGPNSIPFGDALFVDERGRYYRSSRDEQFVMAELPRAEPEELDLERFLIGRIEQDVGW